MKATITTWLGAHQTNSDIEFQDFEPLGEMINSPAEDMTIYLQADDKALQLLLNHGSWSVVYYSENCQRIFNLYRKPAHPSIEIRGTWLDVSKDMVLSAANFFFDHEERNPELLWDEIDMGNLPTPPDVDMREIVREADRRSRKEN